MIAKSPGVMAVNVGQPLPPKWTPVRVSLVFLYFATVFVLVDVLPLPINRPQFATIASFVGALGIWRYGWWATHAVRAELYRSGHYPTLRKNADEFWEAGWRPRHVYFMVAGLNEHPDTVRSVLNSLCRELRDIGVPGTILFCGGIADEELADAHLRAAWYDADVKLVFVRQDKPGKRVALGVLVRALNREAPRKDDLVAMMDADSLMAPDCLRKVAPLFRARLDLDAVTTDEEAICLGPEWVKRWLTMRFAQRRLLMMSEALSSRLLVLTGRCSFYRAEVMMNHDFAQHLESDYLHHWLWGSFRFLSGDDKSTWYYLLQRQATMLYVPDALVYTIERIEGNGIRRMQQNLLRWAGNMLRNGWRSLALGPRQMPFFTWWSLVDQRLSIWTMLVAPIAAIGLSVTQSWTYFLAYLLWIAFSRMCLCLFLYRHAREIDLFWPFMLYTNQLISASAKVWQLFHLSQQRWFHRGNQRADGMSIIQRVMSMYLTILYPTILAMLVLTIIGALNVPGQYLGFAFVTGF